MPCIDLTGVSYAHSAAVPLLADVSLRLEAGWTGVVGPNGAGKTTLLHLLLGRLQPDAGTIGRHPRDLHTHLCAQEVEHLDAEVADFALDTSRAAQRTRGRLALDPDQLDRWDTLSPGERKRWQIGVALAREPGALLLDEPTNHLDAEARDGLVEALARYRGIGVVVSHDRRLLDRLTGSTLRFHGGELTLYRGSYGRAREAWEASERETAATREKLKSDRRLERKRVADSRRRHQKASAVMRTSRNMKNIHDSAARAAFKQSRRRSAEVAAARDVRNASHRVERLDTRLSETRVENTLGRSLFVDWQSAPVQHLMTLDEGELRGGVRVLARDLRLSVGRESRIHVAGPNGSGKTTLLAALVSGSKVRSDQLLHLPQELDESRSLELLEGARRLDPETRGRLMNVVAALGVDPETLLTSERPSPGEARKLCLATGLARRVFGLVLDEPTNHLDLPSIERLEEALAAYPGALVVVSHDRAFASRLTRECWRFADGELHQS